MKSRVLMNEKEIGAELSRISREILERNRDLGVLAIVGIKTRGEFLARRIVNEIERREEKPVLLGVVDITFYRDDLRDKKEKWPLVKKTEIGFDIGGKDIVLVDDVIFTGRTARAAMDVLIDYGRPRSIQLAVLIDRGYRELPIQPNYVGRVINVERDKKIKVRLKECDAVDQVVIE